MSCFSFTFTLSLKRVYSSTVKQTLSKFMALSICFLTPHRKHFQDISNDVKTFRYIHFKIRTLCINRSFRKKYKYFLWFLFTFYKLLWALRLIFFFQNSKNIQKFFKFFQTIQFTKFCKDSPKGITQILSRIYERIWKIFFTLIWD